MHLNPNSKPNTTAASRLDLPNPQPTLKMFAINALRSVINGKWLVISIYKGSNTWSQQLGNGEIDVSQMSVVAVATCGRPNQIPLFLGLHLIHSISPLVSRVPAKKSARRSLIHQRHARRRRGQLSFLWSSNWSGATSIRWNWNA